MIVYHAAWDLSVLRLIETNVIASSGWSLFARCIAGSFLALAGISLALAHRQGVRWRPFLRRLAVITGAAVSITVVTAVVFPDTYIFFGVLHCIAVSSVLALPFLRAPPVLTALAAALSLAAPSLLASSAFDTPALRWTGLGLSPPATNDWVPLLPWFGCVLAGVAGGRWRLLPNESTRGWSPTGLLPRVLSWSGRHSLAIYLLHQPLLFGTLFMVAQVTGRESAAERTPFLSACEVSCLSTGRGQAECARACLCVADGARREGLWAKLVGARLDAPERERVLALTRACFAVKGEGSSQRP